jgi:guanylate kinase
VTTRPPRPRETNGVDYFFVSLVQFKTLIKTGAFLEHIKIPNRQVYYGTLKKPIEDHLNDGVNLIGNLGWPGNESFQKFFPDRVVSIFIKPDSLAVIKKRLVKRDPTISEAEIAKRLANASREIKEAKYYDHVVINHDGKIEQTIAQIARLIRSFIKKP